MKVYQHLASTVLPLLALLTAQNTPIAEALRETMTVDTSGGITFSIDRYDDGRDKPYRVLFTQDGVQSIYRFNTLGFVTNIAVDDSEKYRVVYNSDGDLSRVRLTSSRRRRRNLLAEGQAEDVDEQGLGGADGPLVFGEGSEEEEDEPLHELVPRGPLAFAKKPEEEHEVVFADDGENEALLLNNNNNNNRRRRLYACDDCVEAWDAVCDDGVPSVCALVDYGSPILSAGEASIATMCDMMGAACSSSGGAEACTGQCEEDDDGTDDKVLNSCLDSTSDNYRCSYDGSTTTMDLSNCAFLDSDAEDIPDCFEAFGKTNIERLWLSFQDDLTTLPAGIFSGLSSLVDMDLSYTAISSLPAGVFSGLSALVKLEMHFSQLAAMPEGLFAGMTSLETLIVSSASLTSLPAEVFTPLINLQTLDLGLNSGLQCVPNTTATDIQLFPDEPLAGLCECQPAEAISCETGSCQPGENGYTCE